MIVLRYDLVYTAKIHYIKVMSIKVYEWIYEIDYPTNHKGTTVEPSDKGPSEKRTQ